MVQGTGKMVRLSKCSSYWGLELLSDFYEKVLVKVQREFKNSSSYWKFELLGIRVIASVLYFTENWNTGSTNYRLSNKIDYVEGVLQKEAMRDYYKSVGKTHDWLE